MATANATLLVIDDVEENCEMLKRKLENAGYKVELAIDGEECWSLLNKNKIDLVLLDLDMPVMNGFTFMEKILSDKNFSGIPVVVTSSIDDEDTVKDCLSFGASGFMFKPYDMKKILGHIKDCLKDKAEK